VGSNELNEQIIHLCLSWVLELRAHNYQSNENGAWVCVCVFLCMCVQMRVSRWVGSMCAGAHVCGCACERVHVNVCVCVCERVCGCALTYERTHVHVLITCACMCLHILRVECASSVGAQEPMFVTSIHTYIHTYMHVCHPMYANLCIFMHI